MSPQIMCRKPDIPNEQLLRSGMNCRLEGSEPVSPEHVQKGRFTGVIETQEENFAGLVLQTQVLEDISEPVINEH